MPEVNLTVTTITTRTYSVDRGDAGCWKAVRDNERSARIEMRKWDSISGNRPTFETTLLRSEAATLYALLGMLLAQWEEEVPRERP